MRIIAGKDVYEALDELVDPVHTALVVVDVQNDYASTGGKLETLGRDLSDMPSMLNGIRRLLDAAHASGVLVVYLQDTRLPGARNESPARLREMVIHRQLPVDLVLQGTWGWEIVDAVAPVPGDVVLPKFAFSGFAGTALDKMLRSNRIESIVVTGTATNGCVEATAKAAYYSAYYVVAASDAMADTKTRGGQARVAGDVFTAAEIIDVWGRRARDGQGIHREV